MQIYWNKRKRLHKKRVQLPQDWFGTQIRPPWRHVKTHNIMSTTLIWSLRHASRSACHRLEAYATSIAICITKHNFFKTKSFAILVNLGGSSIFNLSYTEIFKIEGLIVPRSLLALRACSRALASLGVELLRKEQKKNNTKNVCGQAKMDKNSVINVTSWNCTANITRKSWFPGKEKSIIEVQGLKLPIFFIISWTERGIKV